MRFVERLNFWAKDGRAIVSINTDTTITYFLIGLLISAKHLFYHCTLTGE